MSNRITTIVAALSLLTAATAGAQSVRVYLKGGQVIGYPLAELDSLVAYAMCNNAPAGVVAVDLGLPSGTKWANVNVGATTPEACGDYFQWGETVPCTDTTELLGWNTNYAPGGKAFSGTKYTDCGTGKDPMCTSGILVKDSTGNWVCDIAGNPQFDAATAVWGNAWQMPTPEQQAELLNADNCTWKVTTRGGITGLEVTSRANGNSIFLPAGGGRQNSEVAGLGDYGYYWASTIGADNASKAYFFYFDPNGKITLHYFYRRCGFLVRAVAR